MRDWKIFVVNPGKYAEGEETGEWFTLPISEEEVLECLEIKGGNYFIHDYELPFDITDSEDIEHLNRMYYDYEALIEGTGLSQVISELVDYYGSLEEVIERAYDFAIYHVNSMEELAGKLVREGYFGEIPPRIVDYIDCGAVAKNMENNGVYFQGASVIVKGVR